jgi:Ca-activated chloride channel family protein
MPRDFVILLDRSGSMGGDPYAEALRALGAAMRTFRREDRFNIVAFDHEMEFFHPDGLMVVSDVSVQNAMTWAFGMRPRGGTDINTPLKWALELFHRDAVLAPISAGKAALTRLPMVLLITDGCVERDKYLAISSALTQ